MGWQDQGRQQHGWFGDGTSEAPLSASGARDQRIASVAYGAIAALPADQRVQGAALLDAGGLSKLTEVIRAWGLGAKLDTAGFAARFLGRAANDPLVEPLRSAARAADLADSPAALREAAIRLAGVMRSVGLDRWRSFLADAQARALDPATIAAVQRSIGPRDPLRDAIHPVYPLETLLGIAASAETGGAPAAVRALGGALLRQLLPRKPASTPVTVPAEEADPGLPPRVVPPIHPGKQGKHTVGTNNYDPALHRSDLSADATSLAEQFVKRGKQKGKIPVGEPGSKEGFKADEIIGTYRSKDGSIVVPTKRGTLHYSKDHVHIVPAMPEGD